MTIYDASDPPPAGTACDRCKKAGHFCPARGYLGDDAVCSPCGKGSPCDRAATVTKIHAVELNEFGTKMVVATLKDGERRCTDCRGKLGDQAIGTMCWPCRRHKKTAAEAHARRCAAARDAKAAKRRYA